MGVLTFDLDGEVFAVEAISVREILDIIPQTAVPGASALVGSVVNFRGRVIPLADLRVAFGMGPAPVTGDSRIVVIEIDLDDQPTLLGLRADKVHEVTALAKCDSEEPPTVGMRWRRDHVRSLVRRDQGLIVVPDLQAIFASATAEPQPATASIHSIH
ncbi:chemotaxis protein CheW [Sphingomonas gellani]|uniref:chemotaxis protein CheW n=1 Tax=Sphingomonas gellani TaxID=1166340 RepID=UPI003CC7AC65